MSWERKVIKPFLRSSGYSDVSMDTLSEGSDIHLAEDLIDLNSDFEKKKRYRNAS